MGPVAKVEHAIPGRLRVRIPSKRGDTSYFRDVTQRLSEHSGITGITANPATGSILIAHESGEPSIIQHAVDLGLFAIEAVLDPERRIPPNTAQLWGPLSLVFFGLSAVQFVRGPVLGPATENIWQAFGAESFLKSRELAVIFGGLALVQIARGRMFGSAVSLLFYGLIALQLRNLALTSEGTPEPSSPA